MKKLVAGVLAAVMATGVLAGCTIERRETEATANPVSVGQDSAEGATETVKQPQPPKASVEDGEEDYNPAQPVKVKSQGTGLRSVSMVNEEGYEVESELSGSGKNWSTTETLGYNRTYTLTATDKNGTSTKVVFKTATPAATATVALSPLDNSTVGVAQTIGMRFAQAIADRHAAEKAISISTHPKVEGQFYWLNNREVRWRPAEFWEPGTTVEVKADIYGVDLGNGVYGASNNASTFTIGERVVTIVDDSLKSMTVFRNGEALRTIPVSLGREQWATPNGTYIIGDKNESMIMDSESFGLSQENGGYRTPVQYATQMSYSGIYVHAAPWSVGNQGYSNVSHGCVNVTTEAAQWFQNQVKRGDPVVVKNTVGGTLSGFDGLGDWNIPWETWKEGNAGETSAW